MEPGQRGKTDLRFAELLRRHRTAAGLTQEGLGQRAGLSTRTVRYLECGRVRPRSTTLRLLADALGLAEESLLPFADAARCDGRPATTTETAAPPDAAADGPRPGVPSGAEARPLPAQLPAVLPGFVGRAAELRQLTDLRRAPRAASTTVVIALTGTAGIGKTTLAVHWAHCVAEHYPDGQLHADLRGFQPTGSPATPEEVLRGFLDALGTPAERQPMDLHGQVRLYRSLLAGRRVLVMLDDARDAEQVRPLLPGAGDSLVLVTSRSHLLGVIAADGAYPVALDVLDRPDAHDLLAARIGAPRLRAEAAAAARIVESTAGLPLALAIIAAHAVARPHLPLAAVAGQLRSARAALDAVSSGDPAVDVRAAFSCSYRALGPEEARLFRLLSAQPGPDISVAAAASLAGVTADRVGELLARLAAAHLLEERRPGRFEFHDLLRAFATELADLADPGERERAVRRMLDHYLHTAHAAALLLGPRHPVMLGPAAAGVSAEAIDDDTHASAWFTAEHQVLIAVTRYAAGNGFATHAWQLAWALDDHHDRGGHWHDMLDLHRVTLAAVAEHGDRGALAHVHRSLARASAALGRIDDVDRHLHRALELYVELEDRTGQAHAHRNLAYLKDKQGRIREAVEHDLQALDLYRSTGFELGQARALSALGWYHAQLGEHEQALTRCGEALALHRHRADRPGEAATWDSLGYVHSAVGDHVQATACYARALGLYRELGHLAEQATTLVNLGDALDTAGDVGAACRNWLAALDLLDDLKHPDARKVRDKLASRR